MTTTRATQPEARDAAAVGAVLGPAVAVTVTYALALARLLEVPPAQTRSYYLTAGLVGLLAGPAAAALAVRAGVAWEALAGAVGALVGPVVGGVAGFVLALGVMAATRARPYDYPSNYYFDVGFPAGVLLGAVYAVAATRAWSRRQARGG